MRENRKDDILKVRNHIIVLLTVIYFICISLWNILEEKQDYSESERRVLARFPEVSLEEVLSGDFAEQFDAYAVDHFPSRDLWRSIKAYIKKGFFRQKDNNGIYTVNGHISKMEYPMHMEMLDYALQIFSDINDRYLSDSQIYLAVIPDKNRYLADESGHLKLDYEKLSVYMAENMEYAEYIEIADLLEADDYYFTDTHWRQEKIIDVAERITEAMGAESAQEYMEDTSESDITQEYTVHQLEQPFYGVYAGQSALACEPDTICYLTNETINHTEIQGAKAVYDMEMVKDRDPYELFLSGNQPVVTMKNDQNKTGKRLVMFRDSFGSSIAPLLMEGYSEIVLVDLRYIAPDMLEEYVDFVGADVLFLYSTLMLNQSRSMKPMLQ